MSEQEKSSDITKRILAKAEASKQQQIDTVEELARQGEQIKRTQNAMNDINRDLDKANAILADMENPMSWIKGSGKNDEKAQPPASLPSDVQFAIERKKKFRYRPNQIIFTRGQFTRLRPSGELGEAIYYIAIAKTIIHKASGNLTMSFKDEANMKVWKIKMAPDNVKPFVQELIRRAFEFEVETPVEFEDGCVEKFTIDPEKLKKQAPSYAELYGFNKKDKDLAAGADAGGDDADQDLKALSGLLGDMKGLAKQQNSMITEQNAQLDDLTASVDQGTSKLKKTNTRVEKALK
jgi:hypothetical protein